MEEYEEISSPIFGCCIRLCI